MANQQHTLLDKLVKGVITDEVYQTNNRELDAADFMLSNLANIWDSLLIDDRQRFQRVLFSDGVTILKKGEFETTVTSPFINVLQQ